MSPRGSSRALLPPDIARVLDDYRKLGDAARRGLHLAERRTRHEIEQAASHALRLERARHR